MTDEESTDHIVTAVEPAWVEQQFEAGEMGNPEPITDNKALDTIDELHDESEYECSCGEELPDWRAVQTHLEDKRDEDEETFDLSPNFNEHLKAEGETTVFFEGVFSVPIGNPDMAGMYLFSLMADRIDETQVEMESHRYQRSNTTEVSDAAEQS